MGEQIKPLTNRVVIRPLKDPETTRSGLHKPSTGRARANVIMGVVVAVGPGAFYARDGQVHRVPVELAEGDRVMFRRIDGERMDVDEVEHRVLPHEGVLAILERGSIDGDNIVTDHHAG